MDVVSSDIFSHQYQTYIEDTDAGGIVYHANYVKFFDRCRRDWLRKVGVESYFFQSDTTTQPLQLVVNEVNIRYIRPILLDMLIEVAITKVDCKGASMKVHQRISHQGQVLSEAVIGLVCVATTTDSQGQTQVRPTRLDRTFLEMIGFE